MVSALAHLGRFRGRRLSKFPIFRPQNRSAEFLNYAPRTGDDCWLDTAPELRGLPVAKGCYGRLSTLESVPDTGEIGVISKQPNRCPAFLKSGKRCRNKGKPEFGGFCGTHQQRVMPKNPPMAESSAPQESLPNKPGSASKIENLGRIVSLASALTVLIEKASAHLPQFIDVITHISRLAFVAETKEDLEDTVNQDEIHLKVAISDIVDSITRWAAEEREWPRLMLRLEDFDNWVYNRADLPQDLLKNINKSRYDLLRELRSLGVVSLSYRIPRGDDRRRRRSSPR